MQLFSYDMFDEKKKKKTFIETQLFAISSRLSIVINFQLSIKKTWSWSTKI